MRLLGVAAVVGRKVDHDLLARLTELSERELYDSIEAVAAQLLVVDELGDGAPTSSSTPHRRSSRRDRAAEPAPAAPRGDRRGPREDAVCTAQRRRDMAEIAHHWFEGRDLPRALVASIKAGEACERECVRRVVPTGRTGAGAVGRRADPEAISGLDRMAARRAAHVGQLSGGCGRPHCAKGSRSSIGRRSDPGCAPVRTAGRALWTSGALDPALEAYHTEVELRARRTDRGPGIISSPATPRCSCSGAGIASRCRSPRRLTSWPPASARSRDMRRRRSASTSSTRPRPAARPPSR